MAWILLILGSGFVGDIDVRFGALHCHSITQTFSEIVCSTGDPGVEVDLPFSISANGRYNKLTPLAQNFTKQKMVAEILLSLVITYCL